MKPEIWNAVFWVLSPVVVFGLGVFLQARIKGKSGLTLTKLEKRLKGLTESKKGRDPVFPHLRRGGYGASDIEDILGKMGDDGRRLYRSVLRWDLVFPLFYGVTFLVARVRSLVHLFLRSHVGYPS